MAIAHTSKGDRAFLTRAGILAGELKTLAIGFEGAVHRCIFLFYRREVGLRPWPFALEPVILLDFKFYPTNNRDFLAGKGVSVGAGPRWNFEDHAASSMGIYLVGPGQAVFQVASRKVSYVVVHHIAKNVILFPRPIPMRELVMFRSAGHINLNI